MKKIYFYLLIVLFMTGFNNLNAQNYVSFEVNYAGTCGPVNVSFTNTSTLPDTVGQGHFEWFINGKLYSTLFTPPDTIMPAGNHNISMWVSDDGGFSSDYYQDIYIQGFGNIRTIPEEICPNEEVQFHLEGNAEWVIWKFPDGTVSNQWDETYTFDTPGTYTVKALGSTYECGLDSTAKSIVVSTGATPMAEIWVNGNWFCPNDKIKFSSPEAAQHQWVINNDTIYGREIYYAFSDTGQYTVKLTTSNGCGNTNTATEIINIGMQSYPNAWFDVYFDGPNCPNYNVKFEAQASGQFEWDFGDGSFAYDRVVYNTYSDTGVYNVKLITRNGCGYSDTITQPVYIDYYPDNIPGVDIRFKNRDSYIDTLKVCPGTEVHLESDTWGDDDLELTWNVDGNTFHSENLIYQFNTSGLNEIELIVSNNCMGADTAYKYVWVDNTMPPVAQLMVSPYEICPGEEVYFWNEGGHDEWNTDYIQNLVYEIDFGDGETMTNITGETVDFPPVLAAHQYNVLDTFHFVFTAQNNCTIKDTLMGDIIVSDDANRNPFYYVGNSTNDDEGGKMEDWSAPVSKAHEFIVPVSITNWNYIYPMDSTVYLFVWYGNIDPNGDPGPPDGIVPLQAPDTVSIYVPFNVINPNVGIAAVWFCNPSEFKEDPQLYTLPLDLSFNMIQSFPIEPDGVTDFRTEPNISGPLTLDGMNWTDGPCMTSSNKIRNRWYYQSDQGYYVALGIWEDQEGDTLQYDISYGPDRWNTSSFISNGNLTQLNDSTFSFNQTDGQRCYASFFDYNYVLSGDQMTLTNITDTCPERINLLTAKPFNRDDDNWDYDYQKDRTGCPGDSIELYIAGGISYNWHLTDGATSTQPQLFHVYADTGKYEELVVATNACGRVDSIYTTVIIDTTNVPEAFWDASRWDVLRMEPVQFWANSNHDDYGNNVYLWDFGDGTTSTKESPVHYYTYEGDYKVSLTVTNGCGSSTQTQTIWVKKNLSTCKAKFTFDISGKTVTFNNSSIGEITSFRWDFGDGKISELKNPVHTYQDYGVYEVTLVVHDTLTNCSDHISIMLTLGTVECYADYTYQVNETNKSVAFFDESLGDITSWYWEFGDGTFSTDTFPVHNYQNEGVYDVCLTVTDDTTGCMAHKCKTVTVGNVAIFADFNYFVESDSSVTFSDISEGDITNWYWEFGDGKWDTIPSTTHTYAEPGEYHVCLSAFNRFTDAFDDVCKDVMVADTGEVILKAKFAYIVKPATSEVKFIDNSTGEITSWYWTLGDGTYETGDTVVHAYGAPGFYTVCLTVFDSNTGERSELCKTIPVGVFDCNTNAEFGYYVNPTTSEVSFTDKSTGTVNSWFWNFGDGTTSSRKNPKHKFSKPGFYLVSLGVRDTVNDCKDYYADFIQVGTADCNADFEYTVTNTSTNSVQFTNKSVGNISKYFWYFDDGSFATDTNPTYSYDSPGLYKVGLTVSDKSGLCMDNRVKDVQVGTVSCDADFTVYIDSLTNKAYFTNSKVGGATSFYWLFGDGTYFVGQDPVHKYVAPGYYTVSLNTFNPISNCMDYSEKVILIGSAGNDVEADFIYQTDFSTNTVNFSNKSLGENLTYLWDFGDGSTSTDENPVHTYTDPGYHFVCLTATNSVTDAAKVTCKMVLSSNDVADNCLAMFNYDIDTTTYEVTFIDKSVGDPTSYEWDFGDGNTSTDANPTHQYDEPGYYFVILKTSNTTTKCESEDYKVLNVKAGNDSIQAFFTYNVDTTSTGKSKSVDIIGVGHGGGARLSWDFGDGKTKAASEVNVSTLRPKHVYANPGTYNVCLTISDPVIDQSDTYCDSVKITETSTGIEDVPEKQPDLVKIYPNPMQSFTYINYQLNETGKVNITLIDAAGNQIETIVNTFKPAGEHQIIWTNKGLPNGVYYLIFNTGEYKVTKKLILQN